MNPRNPDWVSVRRFGQEQTEYAYLNYIRTRVLKPLAWREHYNRHYCYKYDCYAASEQKGRCRGGIKHMPDIKRLEHFESQKAKGSPSAGAFPKSSASWTCKIIQNQSSYAFFQLKERRGTKANSRHGISSDRPPIFLPVPLCSSPPASLGL